MDAKGQVSFEYILIFAVSLIFLIVFTLPLVEFSMETTFDVSDSIKVKADLVKISSAISQVYGQGQGSKQTIMINQETPIKITIKNNYISSSLKLNNKETKNIKVNSKSNLESATINLKKGVNTLVVEWPTGNENMIIYCKN